MKTFDDWYFDLFEEGNGVCLNQQEIAQESWDYQQEKINELQAKIDEVNERISSAGDGEIRAYDHDTLMYLIEDIQEILK